MTTEFKVVCLCGVCGAEIFEGDKMADHRIYYVEGDLAYIELAHEDCAVYDNVNRTEEYWTIGESR